MSSSPSVSQSYPIQLIVGLANPGQQYASTRHNAGAWLIEAIAGAFNVSLRAESKFFGHVGSFQVAGEICRIFIPSRYMNQNGLSVAAIAKFYQIPPEAILIAHDELDFPPGVIRLKQGGGHGGHNGLRDVIQHLSSRDFFRLRVGIGHPGDRNKVHNYVLSQPSKSDEKLIFEGLEGFVPHLANLVRGDVQGVMKDLHTNN